MKKIITKMLAISIISVLFVSCGTGGLDGTYVACNDAARQGMYNKFIFKGGKVQVVMGTMGIQMPGGYEYGFSREGDKVKISMGVGGISIGSIDLNYNEKTDELRLLFGGEVGSALNEYAPMWAKEGTCEPNRKEEKNTTSVEPIKEKITEIPPKEGLLEKIKKLFSSDSKSTNEKTENEFDRNNISYVYIVNESQAVPIIIWKGGHNFIMFEDKNGAGAVYSYGPVETSIDYPARMWIGTFTDRKFCDGLKAKRFILSAERVAFTTKTNIFNNLSWEFGNEKYVYDTDVTQKFDRFVKFSVSKTEGKNMIAFADRYLINHPQYGVFVAGKAVGQCDNMTSEIANAGGLGYVVLNSPNWSFDNILFWGEIKKRKIVEQYPSK